MIFPTSSHSRILSSIACVVFVSLAVLSCGNAHAKKAEKKFALVPLADGFDYPVGPPDAEGYRKARGFWPNGHLGDDWNGVGGGNSDLGDPVHSIGIGYCVLAGNERKGWGNTVIIRHVYQDPPSGKLMLVDSFYTHLDRILVKKGQNIARGQKIGTIGTNNGMYLAHLHFEVRKNVKIGMNRSKFPRTLKEYWDPTDFVKKHRQLMFPRGKRVNVPIDTF